MFNRSHGLKYWMHMVPVMAGWMAVTPGMTSTWRGWAHRPSSLGLESSASRLPHLEGDVVAPRGRGGVVEHGVAAIINVLLLSLIWKDKRHFQVMMMYCINILRRNASTLQIPCKRHSIPTVQLLSSARCYFNRWQIGTNDQVTSRGGNGNELLSKVGASQP